MSRPLRDRLRELEADVRHLPVAPAAAVRARGRRRRRRQLTATVVGVALVTAAGGGVATLERPRQPTVTPLPAIITVCHVALPDDIADVRVRPVDGGAPDGVVDTTAAQLRDRRFAVLASTKGDRIAGAAALRYGPAAIGAAALLRAEVYGGDAAMWFDPDRRDDTVDLVIGPAFFRLASPTETNQALAAAGQPTPPPQCG